MEAVYKYVIEEPWPWWVGGPLIGLFVIALLALERKQLGISSSYQYICGTISPWKLDYFKDLTKSKWQFYFVVGLTVGGVAISLVNPAYQIDISERTVQHLSAIGIEKQPGFAPTELYSFSFKSILILLAGGLAIGFGARYAGGCTAGHAIMGCSQLAPASIIATVCFFVGGLIASYLIIPFIF